jgi:hypothetical protein
MKHRGYLNAYERRQFAMAYKDSGPRAIPDTAHGWSEVALAQVVMNQLRGLLRAGR